MRQRKGKPDEGQMWSKDEMKSLTWKQEKPRSKRPTCTAIESPVKTSERSLTSQRFPHVAIG